MNKKEIIQIIRKKLSQKKEIIFAYIYGSFVEGASFRDIDVAIYVNPLMIKDFLDYSVKLSFELERAIPAYVFDVRVINNTNFNFIYHVIQGRLIIDKNELLRINFISYNLRRYFDYLPVRKRLLKEIKYA